MVIWMGGMRLYDLFNKLKTDKQDKIINAALNEFSKKNYEDASTNKIIEEAEISKGSLYNYFNSKKELYIYLVNYSAEVIEKIYEVIDLSQTDLFVRLEEVGIAKLKIQQRYPQVFDFLFRMTKEESDAVAKFNQERVNTIQKQGLERVYEKIDYSKFKDEIDVEKAIDILTWTLFGYGNRAIETLDSVKDVDETYLKEWEEYAMMLKKVFYK